MEDRRRLEEITALSHEFGGSRFVHGGGGNTSVKDGGELWIKPSGSTLSSLAPDDFIGIERSRLASLYDEYPASEAAGREAAVLKVLQGAVVAGGRGRPSVETPLHDSIAAPFIVHTHPVLVNGLTCAVGGRAAAARLFPEALWVDYVDPGCTLARRVRSELERWRRSAPADPAIIFLQNHGVFVSGPDPETIRTLYAHLMSRLVAEYARYGLDGIEEMKEMMKTGPPAVGTEDAAAVARVQAQLRESWSEPGEPDVAAGARFAPADGPLTPDHIVYAGSEPLRGDPTPEAVAAYRERFGYYPKVVVTDRLILGVGETPERAALALEMAGAGAVIVQLAAAFGGVRYLDRTASRFIEGWEVERYRQRQI